MTTSNNKQLDETHSSKAINESSKSILEAFFANSQESIEKGVETAFKTLNNSLYATINTAFTNFNLDYDRKLDKNREVHEKAVNALTKDLKEIKEKRDRKKQLQKEQQQSIINSIEKIHNVKISSKIFLALYSNRIHCQMKRHNQKMLVEQFFPKSRKKAIFNSWRNIVNSLQKARIKIKYGKLFEDKYQELSQSFSGENKRLQDILNALELEIQKEMEERRALAKLYDLSMNKGVEVFLQETNYIVDFNSSNVPTPNERSFQDKENQNGIK